MKTSHDFSHQIKSILTRQTFNYCLAAGVIFSVGIGVNLIPCQAQQQPDSDAPGAEVLTRGPVHEAFAGIVTYNPEPGVVVPKAPPAIIEEMPPEEKPEGDNVAWIPGYWAWDDERNDFLWVSGTWRALPPGREWIAGYWGQTPQGYQWTSGYWADTTVQETTYLPQPPATVEVGPNIAAPTPDYGWSPGCWVWYQGRYAWRPGYWVQGRADWDWCPAHYVWTPRGYIFVGGFWDYPVEHRGILFAPVYFRPGVYARRDYSYSPTIVISVGVFSDHLFLRPRYNHYYFGDYYAPSYAQGGFYASFSFQTSRHGYDPIYSHQRWEHRQDREWEHRVEVSYQNRRDHEAARPPRTWAAERNINPGTAESRDNRMVMASPIDQLAKSKDGPMKFQPVAKDERQKLVQRGQEVQQSRDQRRTVEAKVVDTTPRKPGAVVEPAKVPLPRSPIVAKPVDQGGRNQVPPKAPQAPKPNLKIKPQSEPPGRQTGVGRGNSQPVPDQPKTDKTPTPGRGDVEPREKKAQPEPVPRANESAAKAPEASQQTATELPKLAPAAPERRPNNLIAKPSEDLPRKPQGLPRDNQAELKPRVEVPAVKPREDSQRNLSEAKTTLPRISELPPRPRPDPHEKGGEKLLKFNARKPVKPIPPQTPPVPPPGTP